MATTVAEVLNVVARPTAYDNDERTWLKMPFRAPLLSTRGHVQLLQDAESQPGANVPTGTDEASRAHPNIEPRTVRLIGDTDHGTKFETGRTSAKQMRVRSLERVGGGKRTKDSGSKTRDVASVQPGVGDNPATFEETWKAWQHQVDVNKNLAAPKLDDDVKISVVLREEPPKLRDNLLMNS